MIVAFRRFFFQSTRTDQTSSTKVQQNQKFETYRLPQRNELQ